MNPVGAPKKDWPITRRSVPDELWPEIKKLIKEWEKSNASTK